MDERFDPAVRMVPYDAGWADGAQREIERLRARLGTWAFDVQHVGSTSVPGMIAKPIIDLQVSVEDVSALTDHAIRFAAVGYTWIHDPQSASYVLLVRPSARPRTHHVHVCAAGSVDEARHVAVRDFLRAHPDEASAYSAHKAAVVAGAPFDRLAYIAGKAAYVDALELRALQWASRRRSSVG